jgi:cell division protein FtsW (lipid II flippase)/serine/threonine protein phosphatase PrpC
VIIRAVDFVQLSDTGRERRTNEDNAFAQAPLFAVADGMGGARGGEVASGIVVETLNGGMPDGVPPEAGLAELTREANHRIHQQATSDAERSGMGTTLTAAYVGDGEVAFAHVGDSRAYRFRDGKLEQLTEDHSLVGELVRRGKLTPQQAEEHPQRSVITRALGPEGSVQVDSFSVGAQPGDVFLLCSDGLTSMVPVDTMDDILREADSLDAAAHRLIDAANENGGRDNITVVLFRIEGVPEADDTDADQPTVVGEKAPTAGEVDAARATAAAAYGSAAPTPGARGAAQAAPRPARCVAACGPDDRRADRRGRMDRQPRRVLRGDELQRDRDRLPRPAVRAAGRDPPVRELLHLRRAGVRAGGRAPQAHPRQPAALEVRRLGPGAQARAGAGGRMSARNRELFALIPASLLVTGGFAAVFIQQSAQLSDVSLTYGAVFLGLCVAAHVFLRISLPYADPYLFPLMALLAGFGLVVIYRIDEKLAREQAQWFVIGLLLFVATIVFLRDYRVLERYRYLIAFSSIAILLLPRIGSPVNGAYLAVQVGPIQFQPAEFAKLGIVIFLASYLRDTRQLLVQGARRFLGLTLPPLKHFGPLLVVWGLAMLMLFVIRDLGSSVMFFGAFLALLYVATNRLSFPLIGLVLFALGAWYVGTHIGHISARIDAWQDPFNRRLYDQVGGSYQIAQSLFAQADGGMFGTGFGQSLLGLPGGGVILPAAHTDLIYAVITNELGLVGACGVLLTYLLICERGFKIALLARDSFSKLLAAGLASVFALQVFVIVGGVTKVIPLTGVTLPFLSYGGSSILANFVLLALLLLVSDRARRPA